MGTFPKLRIAGFTDAWEQRKVSDLLEERNEQAPESSDYPLMAFIANVGVAPKGERYDRGALVKDAENKLYKRTEIGDFIYSSNNLETGSIGLNNYGNACISPVYSIFKSTGIADSDFIGRRFIRKDFINSMVKWRQGVVYGQWKIHESDFIKIQVAVPSLDEQRKIGEFLSSLDDLITLHQRKCDALKTAKKYFLQNMFPSEGERFPKIRLAGFTDAWEQRKVKELCSISTGKSNTQDKVDDGKYPFYVRSPIIERSTKYIYDEEAVLTVGDGVGTGKVFHYVNGKYDLHQRCYRMFNFTNELNAKYFYHVFSKMFYKRVMSMTAKTSVDSVRMDMIADMEIPVPNIREQEKIGRFLSNLDNVITLHQRKCDALKNAKKFFLQNMFV